MDFAGTVVALGRKVTTAVNIQIGDRVCSAAQGMYALTPLVGEFAQFVGASDVRTLKILHLLSFEKGTSLGIAIGTISLALFKSLEVPGMPESPARDPKTVLLYGDSTATGPLAIQLFKL